LVSACLAIALNLQLPPAYSWVEGALQSVAVALLGIALVLVCVAHALQRGWRNLLATIFAWVAFICIGMLAITAFVFLGPRVSAFVHQGKGALLAGVHIAGSIIAYLLLTAGISFLAVWESQRNERRALENAAVELGVPVSSLNNPELAPQLIKLSSSRYSTELLRNRLSDLAGALVRIWAWLGWALELGVLVAVIWYTATSSTSNAVFAWLIIGIALVFWSVSIIFSLVCKLLTGRYPGEASRARKALLAYVNQNGTDNSDAYGSVV
jgi:hypothetical protein